MKQWKTVKIFQRLYIWLYIVDEVKRYFRSWNSLRYAERTGADWTKLGFQSKFNFSKVCSCVERTTFVIWNSQYAQLEYFAIFSYFSNLHGPSLTRSAIHNGPYSSNQISPLIMVLMVLPPRTEETGVYFRLYPLPWPLGQFLIRFLWGGESCIHSWVYLGLGLFTPFLGTT